MLTLTALADPTRRRIIEMLARGEMFAGAIAERFPISSSAVSQHLKVLREARLVTSRVAAQQGQRKPAQRQRKRGALRRGGGLGRGLGRGRGGGCHEPGADAAGSASSEGGVS